MADFSHILATRPDFDDEDREWLHHLVADWQVIADLSFADLLLLVQDGDGKYVVAEQCRRQRIGSRLCQHSLQAARRLGFRAMQVNLVVSTNTAGIRCWQRNGF